MTRYSLVNTSKQTFALLSHPKYSLGPPISRLHTPWWYRWFHKHLPTRYCDHNLPTGFIPSDFKMVCITPNQILAYTPPINQAKNCDRKHICLSLVWTVPVTALTKVFFFSASWMLTGRPTGLCTGPILCCLQQNAWILYEMIYSYHLAFII